jgi:hypothetical protein
VAGLKWGRKKDIKAVTKEISEAAETNQNNERPMWHKLTTPSTISEGFIPTELLAAKGGRSTSAGED